MSALEQDQRWNGNLLSLEARDGLRWKNGSAPHLNTFEVGQYGRHRTNVWDYDGVNTMRVGRLDDLPMHPTVKPVAMVADAIKDCSKRGSLVLDPFCAVGQS